MALRDGRTVPWGRRRALAPRRLWDVCDDGVTDSLTGAFHFAIYFEYFCVARVLLQVMPRQRASSFFLPPRKRWMWMAC